MSKESPRLEVINGQNTNNRYLETKKLRPITLPRFREAIDTAWGNPWDAKKAGIQEDLNDWDFRLSSEEKNLVSRILIGGFVTAEAIIGDHWTKIAQDPNLPIEVIMLAKIFSAQECNHAIAYDLLESSLNIESSDISKEIAALNKLNKAKNVLDKEDMVVSLAVFAAGYEGISLMSSFALLESFSTRGLLNGMKRIMSWSRNDELLHSAMGIELFHYYVHNFGISDGQVDQIISELEIIIANEHKFIDWCFNWQNLPGIPTSEIHQLIDWLGEKALYNLGLSKNETTIKPIDGTILSYFQTLLLTGTYVDFFQGHNGENYTSGNKARLNEESISTEFLASL
jgi:ribonucleotide reductase beta subunit family protein with ferritin-like domain